MTHPVAAATWSPAVPAPNGVEMSEPGSAGPHVLLLGGSARRPSHTTVLLGAAMHALLKRGAYAHLWELAKSPVPPLGRNRRGSDDPGDALRRAAANADAFVLATPLYHNSYSGTLKNALDHVSATQFRGKPVALLSNSGGLASPQALDHLRVVVRALLGVAIPSQVISTDGDYIADVGWYRLINPAIQARIGETVDELLWFTQRLRTGRQPSDEAHVVSVRTVLDVQL